VYAQVVSFVLIAPVNQVWNDLFGQFRFCVLCGVFGRGDELDAIAHNHENGAAAMSFDLLREVTVAASLASLAMILLVSIGLLPRSQANLSMAEMPVILYDHVKNRSNTW
jgi:hypothetical protein